MLKKLYKITILGFVVTILLLSGCTSNKEKTNEDDSSDAEDNNTNDAKYYIR